MPNKQAGTSTLDAAFQASVDRLDWVCEKDATRQFTHGIHRYSGKFIPQIATQVINLISANNDLILDPTCGSGTTLVEAYLAGRRSLGIDINPLATLLSHVKTTFISRSRLDGIQIKLRPIVTEIAETTGSPTLFASLRDRTLHDAIDQDPRYHDDWFLKWFPKTNVYQLIGIHHAIMGLDKADVRNVALVAFSDVLRKCSYAHQGYPNVMFDKTRRDRPPAGPLFLRRLSEVCDAVATLPAPSSSHPSPEVRDGDARNTRLPASVVDAIIMHPPYVASIPYAEYGLLSLKWLGHDSRELEHRLMGGRRTRSDVVTRFSADYGIAIHEAFRVLKPEKYLFVLVGHPLQRGKRIDLSAVTIDLALAAGFALSARTSRVGVNRRANKMGQEDILFFVKPTSR